MPEYARICQNYARVCQSMPSPLIHGIITELCDIIIYKRGTLSVADTKEIQRDGRMFWPPEAPNPKN